MVKALAVRRLSMSSNRSIAVTRCVTHTCQRPPHAVRQDALDFISYMRDKVVGGNKEEGRYIINMDQTPVFFDMSATGRTLSQSGKQEPGHSFLSAVFSILHH